MENCFVYFYSNKILQNFLSSKEQKVTRNEQNVTSNKEKVTSNGQKVTSNEQNVTNNEQKPTATSKEQKVSLRLNPIFKTVVKINEKYH